MKDKKPEEIWDIMKLYCPYYMEGDCGYHILKNKTLTLLKCVYEDCEILKNKGRHGIVK